MKKMSTLFAAVFMLATIFSATKSYAQFSYGVKAGAIQSAFKQKAGAETDSKTGFVAGAFAAYTIIPNLDVQVEGLYSQLGAKQDVDGSTGKYKFNYINVPVLAKYNVWNGIYAIAGGQFGYLVSAKTELKGQKEDIKDNAKKTDLGLVFGGGYETRNGIGAEIRYLPGMKDISNNSTSIKNVAWQLTLSYRIKSRK
jgi:Outer membrane protein beta-barrel domain